MKVRRRIAKLESSLTSTAVEYAKAGLPVEAMQAATDIIEAEHCRADRPAGKAGGAGRASGEEAG